MSILVRLQVANLSSPLKGRNCRLSPPTTWSGYSVDYLAQLKARGEELHLQSDQGGVPLETFSLFTSVFQRLQKGIHHCHKVALLKKVRHAIVSPFYGAKNFL